MRLPGYAAAASLSRTGRFYGGVLSRPVAGAGPTVGAQLSPCDPCDICGDEGSGGGPRPEPTPCPRDERCCGFIKDGRCVAGQCVPHTAPCP